MKKLTACCFIVISQVLCACSLGANSGADKAETLSGQKISDQIHLEFNAGNYTNVVLMKEELIKGVEPTTDAWCDIIHSYIMLGNSVEAERLVKKILVGEDDPDWLGTFNILLARAYRLRGADDLAESAYKEAEKHVKDPEIFLSLSVFAARRGHVDDSLSHFKAYVEIDDLPTCYMALRMEDFSDEIILDKRFLSILAVVSQRSLEFFVTNENGDIAPCTRKDRTACLTAFCRIWRTAREAEDEAYADEVYGYMRRLGFSDLDILLDAIRISTYLNDGKEGEYLALYRAKIKTWAETEH
jgi:tetratricopeptide (TPR) repeat protein